ncbi:MAG: hypothetical protein WC570_02335 [Patescibacteria group bacterium]
MSANFPLIIFGLALVLAAVAVVLLYTFKPKRARLSQAEFERHWHKITKLTRGDELGWRQAVIEADKLLDLILKTRINEATLGGRLKKGQSLFRRKDNYNRAWQAHKLRNKLVHEVGYVLTRENGRRAINDYRAVFKDLGY